ncbi:MAG: hypothetical protein L0271_08030, partial [Gemmatimonadetes bacterium]|nr:hypothetical protein [Gemmatimonadota bacterium]
SLTDTLANVCSAVDAQFPDMMSMVTLMDPDGQRTSVVASQRVPDIATGLRAAWSIRSCPETMKSSASSGSSTPRREAPHRKELCFFQDAAQVAIIAGAAV